MTYQLQNKVVAITGATGSIGQATAKVFAREGARLALSGRSQEQVEALAAELRGQGAQVFAGTLDVTDEMQVSRYFERLFAEWGYCDVLVNNAAVGLFAPVAELSVELFAKAIDVNLYGALRCIRAVLPVMRARGRGQIINVSTAVAKRSLPYFGGYAATKAALNALTESLRVEVADEGIDVILVTAGLTDTPIQEHTISSRKELPDLPLRGQSPETVAEAIVRASKRRARDVVLSVSGRALVTLNAVTPTLLDKALNRVARRVVGK